MILIEVLGAALLLLGSFLVIHAVWQADDHGAGSRVGVVPSATMAYYAD